MTFLNYLFIITYNTFNFLNTNRCLYKIRYLINECFKYLYAYMNTCVFCVFSILLFLHKKNNFLIIDLFSIYFKKMTYWLIEQWYIERRYCWIWWYNGEYEKNFKRQILKQHVFRKKKHISLAAELPRFKFKLVFKHLLLRLFSQK